MITTILLGLFGLAASLYLIDFLFTLADDPREPPRVRSKFPLLGHAWGLITQATGYWDYTSTLTDSEIYTVGIFHFKIYVCNTRRLMPVIQRHSKTLSFDPFNQLATKKYGNCSDRTYDLHGGPMTHELSVVHRNALGPGPALDDQNARMAADVTDQLNRVAREASGPMGKKVMLLEWVRHLIIQASARGVWGENHPFVDPKVEVGFWTWMDYVGLMIVNLDIFAQKGWAGRQVVMDAMRNYMSNGYPSDCAEVHKGRQELFKQYDIPFEDRYKIETTFCAAVFGNTAPTAHWILWEPFSRPAVLESLRDEIEREAVKGIKGDGFTLDVAALKQKCPLLLSILEETQRTRHIHANIRAVLEDTLLDDQYLLKKGAYLQMPGSPIHHNPQIYGVDPDSFDAYRFVDREKGGHKTDFPHSSFLAWGAPPHLCPARQFAATELMIILALLALRFDIVPVGGVWERNPKGNTGEVAVMLSPKIDHEVTLRVREKYAGAEWHVKMGESKSRVPIASG